MITVQGLKEIALILEHDPANPIYLNVMIAGKPHRLQDVSVNDLELITRRLNEHLRLEALSKSISTMQSQCYSEHEDL